MAVLTPHFDLPFKFGATVEQGTAQDVANCIYMICATPIGYRDEAPLIGIENLAFDTPPVMKEHVRTAISVQEPRADMMFSEHGTEFERIVTVALEVRESLA